MSINLNEILKKSKSGFKNLKSDYLSMLEDVNNIDFFSQSNVELSNDEKKIIIEKLIEAHNLAVINVKAGNITQRGFATNICYNDNKWTLGTNFNNTRNDISSICGERVAILSAYNNALIEFLKENKENEGFNFKIKYVCMAQHVSMNEIISCAIPCEDCLSWLNTERYFDDETIIFSFEKEENKKLRLRGEKLSILLPYKNLKTANKIFSLKNMEYTPCAIKSMEKHNISNEVIADLVEKNYELYKSNKNSNISNQNIVCTIFANGEYFSAKKLDWTKRWFVEPLELACSKAIEKYGDETEIKIISYFGDEETLSYDKKVEDGVVSIKSLGRIRQKYASFDTLLVLNLSDKIFVMTIGDYLPKKFKQGYKI